MIIEIISFSIISLISSQILIYLISNIKVFLDIKEIVCEDAVKEYEKKKEDLEKIENKYNILKQAEIILKKMKDGDLE